MKNLVKLLVLILMMATSVNTHAQHNKQHASREQRASREQLAERQAKHIAKEMAFNDATTQQFVKTFCQFQQEVWALKKPHKQGQERTDAEVEQAMNERFDHSQKLLDLRKKYYAEYSKFLTPRQIEKVYQLERKMMSQLHKRGHKKHQGKQPSE